MFIQKYYIIIIRTKILKFVNIGRIHVCLKKLKKFIFEYFLLISKAMNFINNDFIVVITLPINFFI